MSSGGGFYCLFCGWCVLWFASLSVLNAAPQRFFFLFFLVLCLEAVRPSSCIGYIHGVVYGCLGVLCCA